MVHSGVGPENLAGNSHHDVTEMFNQWMAEKSAFDESGYRSNFINGVYNGKVVGHYSQIVWAENSKVGCGLTYCDNLDYKNLLVCRYETGNIINHKVYTESNYTSSLDPTTLNNNEDESGVSDIIFDHRLNYLLIILLLVMLF
ncbi:hypothetical protein PIROE2DRAFT_7202 [Piromyces sp. E2]|nr:hypothetical protein PIROE2DRAFT_7202 [Piromyces sp. E2]|eukprot:OUM65705.1 hypothetical protein PIROE2DRAFT_7202 [Piromyces sp. E2]